MPGEFKPSCSLMLYISCTNYLGLKRSCSVYELCYCYTIILIIIHRITNTYLSIMVKLYIYP